MPKYVMKIEAVFEAKDDTEAAAKVKKLDETMRTPSAKLFFQGQGVKLITHRVELTPQKQG